MSNLKYEKSFKEITGIRLSTTSLLNMFNILENHEGDVFLNLFRLYIVDNNILEKEELFDMYTAEDDDWWDNISYKHYNTSSLWWLVAMMNNITNPFEDMYKGRQIKILKEIYLYQIFKDIKNISEM